MMHILINTDDYTAQKQWHSGRHCKRIGEELVQLKKIQVSASGRDKKSIWLAILMGRTQNPHFVNKTNKSNNNEGNTHQWVTSMPPRHWVPTLNSMNLLSGSYHCIRIMLEGIAAQRYM